MNEKLIFIARKVIPKKSRMRLFYFKNRIYLFLMYYNDHKRFRKYGVSFRTKKTQADLETLITINYHSIEKGLSNPNFRLGFGEKALNGLFDNLIEYSERFSTSNVRFQIGIGAIKKYIEKHKEMKFDIIEVENRFKQFANINIDYESGSLEFHRNEILRHKDSGFKDLALNRFSVRNYSSQPVDMKLINEAISISLKTPSVCNRQGWNVIVIRNYNLLRDVLKIQGGLGGDGKNLGALIAVTVDKRYFNRPVERNQSYIDGGLFAMSLLYSFEHLGLATCALNADFDFLQDKLIRSRLNIAPQHDIIMFISLGHYPETFKVPKSNRDPLNLKVQYFN